jgi:hypothetical protein
MSKSIAVPFVCSLAALVATSEAAASPPKELYGKSITVFWFESRSQKVGGGLQNPQINIYVSTAGRIFSRLRVEIALRGGFGGARVSRPSATAEQGPGTGGAKVGSTEFTAHSLVITTQFESGARRIAVDFDGGFTSCQAKVLYGKESGQSSMRQRTMFGEQNVEFGAVQISSVGCSVRQGNVFTES